MSDAATVPESSPLGDGVPTEGSATSIPVAQIARDERAWPRQQLDAQRVEEFRALYVEGGLDALPPVEIVADGHGAWILCDGWHRLAALEQLDGEPPVRTRVVAVPAGRAPVDYAFERALACSATAALPLSRAERREAVARLLTERPQASDREIGRLVGVDHATVGRARKGLVNSPPEQSGARAASTDSPTPVARRIALRFRRDSAALGDADIDASDVEDELAAELCDYFGVEVALEWVAWWARRLHEVQAELEATA